VIPKSITDTDAAHLFKFAKLQTLFTLYALPHGSGWIKGFRKLWITDHAIGGTQVLLTAMNTAQNEVMRNARHRAASVLCIRM
jgi:hypothetical protein